MDWGFISYKNVSHLYFIELRVNTNKYKEILRFTLKHSKLHKFDDVIFRPDGTSFHRVKLVNISPLFSFLDQYCTR